MTIEASEVEPAIEGGREEERARGAAMFAALGHRNYRLFWSGSLLSNIGTWMQIVAQGWLVRELTPSPLLIGFVAFAGSFPQLAFALFSGVYADLLDRRRLLLATQTLQLSCAALLGTLAWLWQSGIWPVLSIWHIIAISFVNGMAATLAAPAYQTLTLDLVGRQDLMSAIALNSAQFNVSRIVGPTLGGIVYSAIGLAGCFYFNSLSSLAVIAALRQVRIPHGLPSAPRAARDVIRQLIAGLRYVWGRPRVLALLGIASVVSICGLPYLTFMPVFARDVLGVDARGLGALWAAVGTGALTSALLLAAASDFRRRGWLLLIGAIFFGSAIIAFALSRGFWFSFFALMAVGGGMSAVATTVNTLLQSLVVDEMRGRVMSMYTLSVFGFAPLGSLLVGVLAQLIGPRGPYLGTQLALGATGVMIILYALAVLIRRPAVRALP